MIWCVFGTLANNNNYVIMLCVHYTHMHTHTNNYTHTLLQNLSLQSSWTSGYLSPSESNPHLSPFPAKAGNEH